MKYRRVSHTKSARAAAEDSKLFEIGFLLLRRCDLTARPVILALACGWIGL